MNQFYTGYFLLLHSRALCTVPFIFHTRTATPFNLSPGPQNALCMQSRVGTQRPPSPGTEGGMWFVYPEISGTSAEIPEKNLKDFL